MKMLQNCFHTGALVLLALALATQLSAAEDTAAARVLLVVGTVEAMGEDGSVRELTRGDPIYQGDTVRSASNGRAQLRFTDGARMSIRPDSELSVDDYEFADAAPPEQSRSTLSLRKGGFRTATGAVADRNRSAYRVSTPFAVIGVRGTDWSAAIADIGQGENLFLGINEGGITASNDAGSIDLSDADAFLYARIRSFSEMPEGLQSLPTRVATTFRADALPTTEDDSGPDGGPADAPAPGPDGGDDDDGGPPGGAGDDDDAGGPAGPGGDDDSGAPAGGGGEEGSGSGSGSGGSGDSGSGSGPGGGPGGGSGGSGGGSGGSTGGSAGSGGGSGGGEVVIGSTITGFSAGGDGGGGAPIFTVTTSCM